MKIRGARFRWVAAMLLLVLLAGSWGIRTANGPQRKPCVLKCSGPAAFAHKRLKFMYPADYAVDSDPPSIVSLKHIPPTGLARWIEEHLYKRRSQDWDDAYVVVQYFANSTEGIDKAEATYKQQMAASTQGVIYKLRRVRHPLGQALVIEEKSSQANGNPHEIYEVYIFLNRTSGEPFQPEVFVRFWSSTRVAPQFHRAVDEIVSSMQVVPL